MIRTTRSFALAALCAVCAVCAIATASAGAATAPAALPLVLPLAANSAGLARFATAVSTPGSPLYRHYRSITWLAQHFGASAANERKVVAYLRAAGATRVRIDRTGLFVDATVKRSTAETLFGTALAVHAARAGNYTTPESAVQVPAALRGAVTGVIGLNTRPVLSATEPAEIRSVRSDFASRAFAGRTAFSTLSSAIAKPGSPINPADPSSGYIGPSGGTAAGCAAGTGVNGFSPNEYLTAYNLSGLQAAGTVGQGERVALIETDGFRRSDINVFAKCFGLKVPKIVTFRTSAAVPRAGLAPGGESTLDLEVLDAAAPGLSQIDVYQSGPSVAAVTLALTAPLQNSGYTPEVISASLGLCEPQVREAIGLGGLGDAEAAIEEATASGISVLAASGDDGSSDCLESEAPDSLPAPELAVNYPASSPFVTAVGGTNLSLTPANAIAVQQVWNDASDFPGSAGGGGYSRLFNRPSYQDGLPAAPTNVRVVPDVSMLADIGPGYDIYCTAQPECVSAQDKNPWGAFGGTSAATPLLAGGLALVDEVLRQHKQEGLGLVNPLLYALGKNTTEDPLIFSDVTLGSNDVGPYIRASGAPLGCCNATVGFDAASGLGSVNVGALATAALMLKPPLVSVSESLLANRAPVAERAIYARVACSGRCVFGAFAKITIGTGKPVSVFSSVHHLAKAGLMIVKIPLPAAELKKLKFGVRRHLRIRASVIGVIIDPAGNIERSTPAKSLTITR